MEVAIILLQPVKKLGNIGDVVKVKRGFARNFLIPFKKAVLATESNKTAFEERRKVLEAEHKAKHQEAEKLLSKLPKQVVIVRQAADDGHLFGSVTSRDIASLVSELSGVEINRAAINLPFAIKQTGIFDLPVTLYGDVSSTVAVNVARSEEEAQVNWDRRNKGEKAKAEEADAEGEPSVDTGEAAAE